jgi:hypothetical protein
MKKPKARDNDPTGYINRGRHTFHPHEGDVVRAFIRAKIAQVQNALARVNSFIAKRETPELVGQRDYWATVLGYLNGVYRQGTRSVDALDWSEAWKAVTVDERYKGSDGAPITPPATLPGM